MEDYTTYSSVALFESYENLRKRAMVFGNPETKAKFETAKAELDRRCQIFSWVDDLLHIEPQNPFITVHQGIMAFAGQNRAWPNIISYPISNPAEFSALLQYFISKPKL